MWHVDEGALHAYLDGALDEYPGAEARRVREHLEACAECAERLAAERRTREEAQDILALASPRVEIPSLEDLRAYVKAQAPPRTKARIRLYRLSWAASVVLALGTGWLLRGGVPQTMGSGASGFAADPADASVPTEPAAQPASASETELSTAAATGPTSEPRAGSPAAPDAVADAQRVAPPASAASAPPPAGRVPSEQAADRVLAQTELRRERAERQPPLPAGLIGGARAAALADGLDADLAATKAAVDTDAATDTAAHVVAANAGPPAPEPTAAAAPTAPTRTQDVSASADRDGQDTPLGDAAIVPRTADQRLQSAITRAPTATVLAPIAPALAPAAAPADASTDSADLDAEDEPASLVVPGLEVLDVLRIGQETTFLGTRALQLLPTGDTLETAHLPPGVDATVLPPLRPGWSELIQPRGSGWLVMRAPVPPNALAELLRRLEAGH